MSKNNYINSNVIATAVATIAGFFLARYLFSYTRSKDKIETKSSDTNSNHSISKISDVIKIIKDEPQTDTLVVFDIDGVILRSSPIPYFFGRHYDSTKRDVIINKIIDKNILFRNNHQLFNKKGLKQLIDFLDTQHEKIYSICLTHSGIGNYKLYPSGDSIKTEDVRIENLKPYDDYFFKQHKALCKISDDLELNLPLNTMNPTVLFKKGILFVGNENINFIKAEKGYVLIKFLEKIKYLPKKIIFIDDIPNNIFSVQSACKILGIKCVGILHERNYDPKFQTKKFLSSVNAFFQDGIMHNDDSDEEESDESISKDEISKEFNKAMENLDKKLDFLPSKSLDITLDGHLSSDISMLGNVEYH